MNSKKGTILNVDCSKLKFIVAYKCVSCHEEVSNSERLYLDGVCPRCGHVSNKDISMIMTYRTCKKNPEYKGE